MIKDNTKKCTCRPMEGNRCDYHDIKGKDTATPRPWKVEFDNQKSKTLLSELSNMDITQATKRPWRVKQYTQFHIKFTCIESDNGRIAKIKHYPHYGDTEANAQLIVKSVNEYDENKRLIDKFEKTLALDSIRLAKMSIINDELFEALKTLVYNCECIIETEGLQVLGLEIAKQALSRAESEPIK